MSSESQKEYPQGEGIVVPDISAVPTVLKSILTQLKNAISVKKIRGLSPFLGLGKLSRHVSQRKTEKYSR